MEISKRWSFGHCPEALESNQIWNLDLGPLYAQNPDWCDRYQTIEKVIAN